MEDDGDAIAGASIFARREPRLDQKIQSNTSLDENLNVASQQTSIPVVEETVRIDKRVVEGRRVRVETRTESVEQVLKETLRSDAVGVTRVSVDRVVAEGEALPQVRTEAGVTIIPVLEEVLVVEKRLVLKEEVHIRQTTSGEEVEVPVTVRKQHAVIEESHLDGSPASSAAGPVTGETISRGGTADPGP